MTPRPIGCMRAHPGRSGVRTLNTRRWSWRRSSCSTCTSRGTVGMRWRALWTWRSGRWRSGFKTGEWKWRNRARTNPRTSEIGACVRTHIYSDAHARTPAHTMYPTLSPLFLMSTTQHCLPTNCKNISTHTYTHICSFQFILLPRELPSNHANLYNWSMALLIANRRRGRRQLDTEVWCSVRWKEAGTLDSFESAFMRDGG